MPMILTSECENCVYGEIFLYKIRGRDVEKVRCSYKEKEYFYGQCIPCEHKQKKEYVREDDEREENKDEQRDSEVCQDE